MKKMISLAEKHPELILEWDSSNADITPWNISYGSNKKATWKGKCGHTWKASIKNRASGSGCPICSGNAVSEGINDLATLYPELASEWSSKNLPMKPESFTVKANKNVLWECQSCGHEWKARIADRTDGHGCPVCSGEVIKPGINDLKTLYPQLANEWSLRNESEQPSDFSPKSRKKVWWRCRECGFEWEAVIDSRVRGLKCPSCQDRVINPGFNDLESVCPELAAEWDYEHNRNLTPDKILSSSMRPVFWKDYYGHIWRAKISERMAGAGCPYCKSDSEHIFILKAIAYYIQQAGLSISYMSDEIIGIPLELYIPEKKVGIEFTENRFSSGELWLKETAKNWLCIKAGIKLFRLMLPDSIGFDNCACIHLSETDLLNYKLAIRGLLRIIRIDTDIDFERDLEVINNTELIGGREDEETDNKDNTSGTWNSTLACNMLPYKQKARRV